jgi:hypothetical protein
MPQDNTFLEKTSTKFRTFNTTTIKIALDDIALYTKNVNYFRNLLLHYQNEMYVNPIIKDLINSKGDVILSNKSIAFIQGLINSNTLDSILKTSKNKDIITIYFRGLITNYEKLIDSRYKYNSANKFKDIPEHVIFYLLRVFFNNVEHSLLRGHSYRLNRVEAYIKIVRKPRKKKRYNNQILRKTEDWGRSMKFLIEQSKDLDLETHNLYINKRITKRQFIQRLKPHLYSPTNTKGLKWIFYSDREDDAWLILSHRYSSIPNIRHYSITPKNDISTADQSQIKFTDECENIDEIIETKLLGLRDKIRALERFDPEYCNNTFKLI